MLSAASDLALLEAAAHEAGAVARAGFGRTVKTWSKGEAGPVTEIDLAVDKLLRERLIGARPQYGWLSEETPDTSERLSHQRVFVVDPIDGTGAFIAGKPHFMISIGLVDGDRAVAGAIYNPMLDEMYLGGEGVPATLNGAPIRASARATLPGARLLGKKRFFYAADLWNEPWPELDVMFSPAIAERLAFVAAGHADGAVMPGYKNDWDIAAGVAIIAAAGGGVSDQRGRPLVFNRPDPRAPGVVAAGPNLQPLLIERLAALPPLRTKQDQP